MNTNTTYQQVRQKGSHNSYQRSEGYDDQLLYWRIRSLEIDIHNSNNKDHWPAVNGDWYVYHTSTDDDTSVNTLSDALDVLMAFHRAIPEHEVITIWLDLKDSFVASSNQTPQSLDDLFANKLGLDNIWGPPNLIGSENNLQSAINAYGWPTLDSLQGKFIIACTTGDLASPDSHLNQYVDNGATANQRLAFVAPDLSNSNEIEAHNYAIIFNLSSSKVALSQSVFNAGFISRAYGLDSQDDWCDAWNNQVHHLASNKVNATADEWARTDLVNTGYPFTGINTSLDPNTTEIGALFAIKVNSGDLDGESDSCYFQFDNNPNAVDTTLTAFIGNPESHVNSYIKAGLMARASNHPNSSYVAMLRTGSNGIRMQFRLNDGDDTFSIDAQIADGVNGEPSVGINTPMWLQLSISNGGKTVKGSYSTDGTNWIFTGQANTASSLANQGWVASSHGDGEVKWLFGGMQAPSTGQAIGDNAAGVFISSSAEAASLGPKQSKYQCDNN
ncbi:MAG TPA: hypothetical protein ENJ41_05175 [Oceanospirillales bacterium]|nr:hypothetical protein [Oceanospirillales bacterium]